MSAFHLLNVSPESSRAEIDVAYEEAGFNDKAPEGVLQKAVGALTASKPRLYEEVSYWWGIPCHKIDEFTHSENPDTGKILVCEAIKTMPLPALTRVNIAAHLCENKSIGNTSTFVDRLNALIKEQKNIDTDDVGKMINHARKKSGAVPIAKSEHITNALAKLREEQHIKAAINMIFYAEHPGTLATNITDKWRFDKTASGRFVADLIRGAYKSRIQPILQPLEQEIDHAVDILWDSPRNEPSLQLIEQKLSEWDEYVQPLQLIDEGKGFDEKRSSEICSKLRDLSLHLHNNEGESDISLRISNLLNKVFPELPETAEQLAHDLSALKNIVDEKHRDTKIKARLQALMNAVESIQNISPDMASQLNDFSRTDINNFDDLINAFSALLNEYPDVVNEEEIWLIARSAAIVLHNKHNATYEALDLTKRLLTLANNFNAPRSVVDKLQQDKNDLQAIPDKGGFSFGWVWWLVIGGFIWWAVEQDSNNSTSTKTTDKSYASAKPAPSYLKETGYQTIEVEGLGILKFPNSMNDEEIKRVIDLELIKRGNQAQDQLNQNPQPEHRREAYVTASKLNVRNSPSGEIIGYYNQYESVVAIGSPKNGWQKIVWVSQNSQNGYVYEKYIKNGDGTKAKCEKTVVRPKSGSLLNTPRGHGTSAISVHNGGNSDVIIKLRDQTNNTVIAFYLRQSESYTYKNVPNAPLLFTYADGRNYSTQCGVFMDNMHAYSSPNKDDYSSGSWTYNLESVTDGNFRPQGMNIENF